MENKMEMNDKSKSRLYLLTSMICLIWLGQVIFKAWQTSSLWSIANLVFYASMIIVVGYTGYSGSVSYTHLTLPTKA